MVIFSILPVFFDFLPTITSFSCKSNKPITLIKLSWKFSTTVKSLSKLLTNNFSPTVNWDLSRFNLNWGYTFAFVITPNEDWIVWASPTLVVYCETSTVTLSKTPDVS